jgi:predicted nucleic acid-binding protein
MAEPFVDTNILIRLLTGDDPEKQERAKHLFEHIERKELQVTARLTVIADTVYVLSSARFYNLPRSEIAALLRPLLRLPAFRIRQRELVLRALEFYEAFNFDFTDAVIYAAMLHARSKVVYSFDEDFDELPEITRQEP